MYPIQNQEKYGRGFSFKNPYPAGWGKLTGKPHLGIDIQCPVGTPIYATFDGVIKNSEGAEGGYMVTLSNPRYSVRHLHLSKQVNAGNVKKGAIIGYTGGAKGAEGSGTSSGPHIHCDVSYGKPQVNNIDNFINPDNFFQEINILVVGADDYDLTDLVAENPYFNITKKIKILPPVKWVSINGEIEVDQNWFDLNVWEAGYDIVVLVTKDYKRPKTTGYAQRKQSLGSFRCFVHDTGLPRIQGIGNGWRRINQVAGTIEHEVYHLLHNGIGIDDKTHDLDKGEGFPVLAMTRFKGYYTPGYVRLVKKSFYSDVIKEKIVAEKYYSTYSGLLSRFGYKKFL
jgi:hypothetical protein